MNRRDFIRASLMTTAGLRLKSRAYGQPVHSRSLRKFAQPLPGLGSGIPVATPVPDPVLGASWDYYQLQAGQYTQSLHPDLGPTTLWGYSESATNNFKHLGPVIVAQKGRPVRVRMTNHLPPKHILPVDTSLPGAELVQNRIAVHLHGGYVPWTSDGGPMAWFAPDGSHGDSFMNNSVLKYPNKRLAPAAGQADYLYPNEQSARLMWYHDHAMGITRLNAYAGLASGYLVTDDFEQALVNADAIPKRQIPLIIQDKTFNLDGSLWYPSEYDADPGPNYNPPAISCVPEFFGDTMLVNGVVHPYVNLEPRKYRLRILNACNARFCRLQLFYAQTNDDTAANLKAAGPPFLQIGTEGGFLPSTTGPVPLNQILLAPAERADLIIDLSLVAAGSRLILYNDAPAPFPSGDPENDYPNSAVTPAAGYGPDTRSLLQIIVVPLSGGKDPRPTAGLKLPAVAPLSSAGARIRDLTLNEDFDDVGRLIQRLGTNVPIHPGTFARNYMDGDPTEIVAAGAVEVWRIFNLTGDTHPIHFHLINVQLLSRQAFDVKKYTGSGPKFTGPARGPEPNETGYKETIRMNPGDCTTVIAQFNLPTLTGIPIPANATGGHEYVWHCHILEHEEHDMMRPLIVK